MLQAESENVIEVENLTKKYKDFEALKGLSFNVHKNEIFGMLGPNGAGKTTTMEIIEGLKSQNSGKCVVLGFDNRVHANEIKKRIGIQLQTSEYLDYLTLKELLLLFASLYGQTADPKKALAQVGLESKMNSFVKQLSGGQKQRFTIASALVHTPEILFLDEPTTGLDPQARRSMWQLIKDLNSQGITIVMTTHYIEEAEYLCDRVAILDSGKVLKIGWPQKLINEIAKTYQMNFFVSKALPDNFFSDMSEVSQAAIKFPKVILEINDIEIVPKIIQELRRAEINISFLNLKTATLEDVYLKLTGHEYEQD